MTHGVIVAPQPEAVEIGAMVYKDGGNCVDAAIACAFAQGVVDPQMTGIAGFGTMQVYLPGRDVHENIDFHSKAPAATRADQWANLVKGESRDGFGFILEGQVNEVGYQSVGIPGGLKGYWHAHSAYGALSWERIIKPSIKLAEEGFVIRPHIYTYWTANEAKLGRVQMEDKLKFSEEGKYLYFEKNGDMKRPGAQIINRNMASTLRVIAQEGADAFYNGSLTDQIIDDFEENSGILSREDLADYSTNVNVPLWGSYRGFEVSTNRPPGGGIMVLQILNILENFNLKGLGHNSVAYIHTVSEAMKLSTVDKEKSIGDPNFVDVPMERLLNKEYAMSLAGRIRSGPLVDVRRLPGLDEPKDTTHTTAVDEHGGIVSMTHSLGSPSGVITSGLGFMYNGSMAVFDPRPGYTGSLAPGKSRFSAMSPTILFDKGEPFLALGAPGGTAITMAVAQVILNVVEFGMSVSDAVSAPRFSATSNSIDIVNRIPRYISDELERMGHGIERSYLSYTLGGVHAVHFNGEDWTGGADPGRDGMALSV